jgi:hypothetical protein
MTLSAHGVPPERQPRVSPMRIPVGDAAAWGTTERPSGVQRPASRSRFDLSLIDVCHPYRKFLSTTLLSVLPPEKLRGVSQGAHDAGMKGRIEHRRPRRVHEGRRTNLWVVAACRDRKRLSQQLALRQAIESRALRRKLANQRRAIQKSPHPGSWRHFVASRAADRDARAIRVLQRRERQQRSHDLERGC